MKIGLVDVDSHNFPNIPLMKISAYHKSIHNDVEFYDKSKHYDKVYKSKIFTESEDVLSINADIVEYGGSGYDLLNKLPDEIEKMYPDYSLYPQYTQNTAYGILTRGCPRVNHTFCITPKKDGVCSKKVADLDNFWDGEKNIVLLDQNILACKEHLNLLQQLAYSKATVEFNGGLDLRFVNDENIEIIKKIKVKDYHFAWDDPRESLEEKFKMFKNHNIKRPDQVGVYVLVNYWSTIEEDLYRIYTLREMGFMPYVMIYDKQKFVNSRGRWLDGVENKFSEEQLIHFKICQHMQRWCNNRKLIKMAPNFKDYEPYLKFKKKSYIKF